MSIQIYDNAFVEKLRKWTLDTSIHVISPSDTQRLFKTIADENNDRLIHGMFNLYFMPLSYNGEVVVKENMLGVFNAVAVSIPYQLDVYTRYMEEADELVRNLVFNIINYPMLQVTIPYYELGITHNSTIRLSGEVQNNSDIPERLVPGQFTRYTLDMVVDDAYLFDIKVTKELKMCPNPDTILE